MAIASIGAPPPPPPPSEDHIRGPVIRPVTGCHVLPISRASGSESRGDIQAVGFSSVAEANLFGIMGITGAADTEASKDGGREGGRRALTEI